MVNDDVSALVFIVTAGQLSSSSLVLGERNANNLLASLPEIGRPPLEIKLR